MKMQDAKALDDFVEARLGLNAAGFLPEGYRDSDDCDSSLFHSLRTMPEGLRFGAGGGTSFY
jgi:hypothetical protein